MDSRYSRIDIDPNINALPNLNYDNFQQSIVNIRPCFPEQWRI